MAVCSWSEFKGLTPIPDWIRAYEEINDFERTLADDGIVMVKFWLHISREEQLRRFIDLDPDPEHGMASHGRGLGQSPGVRRNTRRRSRICLPTPSTEVAPWTVVPANDMHYKTYLIFKTIIDRLEEALDVERTEWKVPADVEKRRRSKKKQPKRRRRKPRRPKTAESNEDSANAAEAALGSFVEEIERQRMSTVEDLRQSLLR